MVLSCEDVDVLRLLRWCRYIARADLALVFKEDTISNLLYLKLIVLHEKSQSFLLTKRGNQFLDEHLEGIPASVPASYRIPDMQRRLRVASLTMTAYRAGVDVFAGDIRAIEKSPSCFLTAQARVRGFNPWGSTRVAAVTHLANSVLGIHYVCPGIGNLSLTDELTALSNNTAHIRSARRGMIFAGETYRDVLAELPRKSKESNVKLITYGEAYRSLTLPVYLLSCDDTGVLQLRIMAADDYRTRLAMAALKSHYAPPLEGHPEWDAMYDGDPFIVAADMDLRRINKAIGTAREGGFKRIVMVALQGQADAVLAPRFGNKDFVRVFALTEGALGEVADAKPYAPPHRQFETAKGDVIDAPLIQAYRKAGGSGGK